MNKLNVAFSPVNDYTCHVSSDYINVTLFKMSQITPLHAKANQQYGRALKILLKQSEEKSSSDLDKKCIEVCYLYQI
jgi:hypothetical protein